MMRQYYAQRFRECSCEGLPWLTGKRVGTIPVGTILYIQDAIHPLRPLSTAICREPWMVEAWIPRDYSKLGSRGWETVRIAGGHLAQVRSLRNRRRVQLVADWILLRSIDAGLEKMYLFSVIFADVFFSMSYPEPSELIDFEGAT